MHRRNVIEPSNSSWAAPVILAQKKDGSWRFCVDYRRLNAITNRDVYSLPRIEDARSRLEGCKYFSIIDTETGYWHSGVRAEDREKTAFITADGLNQFRVISFGLTNAPATFQLMMDVLLSGLIWITCLVYLDDDVIFPKTFGADSLRGRLATNSGSGLKLKLSKCFFFTTCSKSFEPHYQRRRPHLRSVKSIRCQELFDAKHCLRCSEFCRSYYLQFIPNFAALT